MFSVGIGVRAALVGVIAFAILQLLATQHLYATAIVLSGIAALILVDLARYVSKGDRMLERFVEGLAAGELERPARGASAFRRLCSPRSCHLTLPRALPCQATSKPPSPAGGPACHPGVRPVRSTGVHAPCASTLSKELSGPAIISPEWGTILTK